VIFFTSDTHLQHKNIIQYCTRPYPNVPTMDDKIIENWNKVVKRGDTVYHLGDFAFCCRRDEVEAFIKRLNGQIHLICGNHDKDNVRKAKGFASVRDIKKITVKYKDEWGRELYQDIVLCHYAMKVWEKSGHGSWQLYGHSHGTLPDDKHSFQCDVGVDNWNFTPVSFAQIREVMKKKYYIPQDYHGHTGLTTIPDGPPAPKSTGWIERDYQSGLYDFSDLFDK